MLLNESIHYNNCWFYHICRLLSHKASGRVDIPCDRLHIIEVKSVKAMCSAKKDMRWNNRGATTIRRARSGYDMEAHLIWKLLHNRKIKFFCYQKLITYQLNNWRAKIILQMNKQDFIIYFKIQSSERLYSLWGSPPSSHFLIRDILAIC